MLSSRSILPTGDPEKWSHLTTLIRLGQSAVRMVSALQCAKLRRAGSLDRRAAVARATHRTPFGRRCSPDSCWMLRGAQVLPRCGREYGTYRPASLSAAKRAGSTGHLERGALRVVTAGLLPRLAATLDERHPTADGYALASGPWKLRSGHEVSHPHRAEAVAVEGTTATSRRHARLRRSGLLVGGGASPSPARRRGL